MQSLIYKGSHHYCNVDFIWAAVYFQPILTGTLYHVKVLPKRIHLNRTTTQNFLHPLKHRYPKLTSENSVA